MGCTLVFYPVSYLLFFFEFAITFWVLLVNSFRKVRVETSSFPDYILDETLDNDTPNGDNCINDNDDHDENCIYDNNENNDRNQYNDHTDDDNDNNYDNNNTPGNAFWKTFYL